jgi:8-oxo-dGTP pyrophosphatase MutT (NUDIX family)
MIHSYGIIPLQKKGDFWHAFVVFRTKQFWEFPKGHAEKGESPFGAAKRELQEETGLKVDRLLKNEPLQEFYTYEEEGEIFKKEVFYFLAVATGEVSLQKEEVLEGKWVKLSDLEELVTFDTSKSLARKTIQYLQSVS